MLQWKISAPRQLELVENAPTTLNDIDNTKVKVEHVLFGSLEYSQLNNTNPPTLTPCRHAVGVVSESLPNTLLEKMDRVIIEPYQPCNTCIHCNDGNLSHCQNMVTYGKDTDGVLRNFIDVPASQLHKLPETLGYDKALFIPFVSWGINVVDSLSINKGQHVTIFANNYMGLIIAQLLSYYKAVPILVCSNAELVSYAKNNLGIFYAFDSSNVDINREIQIVTGGRMCHEIIYLADSGYTIAECLPIVSQGGTICISGNPTIDSSIDINTIVDKKLSIHGVYSAIGNYQSAINLILTNQVSVDDIAVQHVPFSQVDTDLLPLADQSLPIIIDVE